MLSGDRTQEIKNSQTDEKIYNLEKQLLNYVTKEEQAFEMRDKVTWDKFDQVQDSIDMLKQISISTQENL